MESAKSTWMVREIVSRPFRAISWIEKPDVPEVEFEYNRRLDLFGEDAWKVARETAAAFPNEADGKGDITEWHLNFSNCFARLDLCRGVDVFAEAGNVWGGVSRAVARSGRADCRRCAQPRPSTTPRTTLRS